jgi:hypothetical protein
MRVAVARPGGRAQRWHDAVIEAIGAVAGVRIVSAADRDADVVVDLSNDYTGVAAPLGIWRFAFGDGTPFAGGARGTLARLYRTTGDPARAVVLHEGWYRAQTAAAWGTRSVPLRVAPWCARVLRQVAAGDADVLSAEARPTAGCADAVPPHASTPLRVRIADATRDWRTRQRWSIGIAPGEIADILERGSLPQVTWMQNPPADRFYADPFPLERCGDRLRVVVEDYRYRSRDKLLTTIDVSLRGALLAARRADGLPVKASYPFLLRRGGSIFCVPETFRSCKTSAFRREPDGAWRHAADLLTGMPVVDPTIVEWNGRWWLFCTKQGDEDQTELHVFHASDWRGPWAPHLLNPVKADTRSARPAGACVVVDGGLYRPAQNCARHYGAGIAVNRVVELSPTRFREEPAVELWPDPASAWPDGLHTINSLGGVTVVDGLRLEPRNFTATGVRHRLGGFRRSAVSDTD